jgi:hypothetical protein
MPDIAGVAEAIDTLGLLPLNPEGPDHEYCMLPNAVLLILIRSPVQTGELLFNTGAVGEVLTCNGIEVAEEHPLLLLAVKVTL